MAKQKQIIKDKRVMWIILGLLLVLIIAYFVSSNSGEWFLDRGEDIEQFEGPIFENAVLRQYNTDTPPMKHTGGPQLFERANIHDIRQSMLINENNALEFLDLREMVRISEDELNEVMDEKEREKENKKQQPIYVQAVPNKYIDPRFFQDNLDKEEETDE